MPGSLLLGLISRLVEFSAEKLAVKFVSVCDMHAPNSNVKNNKRAANATPADWNLIFVVSTLITLFLQMATTRTRRLSGSKSSSNHKLGFTESFFLSGSAAAIAKTCAAPIERVKLLLQNQNELLKQGKLAQGYSGVKDCITRTLTHEGALSFWRGNFASVIRYFPQQALNFAFKDQVRPWRDWKRSQAQSHNPTPYSF